MMDIQSFTNSFDGLEAAIRTAKTLADIAISERIDVSIRERDSSAIPMLVINFPRHKANRFIEAELFVLQEESDYPWSCHLSLALRGGKSVDYMVHLQCSYKSHTGAKRTCRIRESAAAPYLNKYLSIPAGMVLDTQHFIGDEYPAVPLETHTHFLEKAMNLIKIYKEQPEELLCL